MSLPESDMLDPTIEAEVAEPADNEQFEKPRAGVYTMLLIVSFFSLLTGTWCLHKEMQAYDFDFKASKAKREAKEAKEAKDMKTLRSDDQGAWLWSHTDETSHV